MHDASSPTSSSTTTQTFHLKQERECSTQTSKTILQLAQIEQIFAKSKQQRPDVRSVSSICLKKFQSSLTEPNLTDAEKKPSFIECFLSRRQNYLSEQISRQQLAINRFTATKYLGQENYTDENQYERKHSRRKFPKHKTSFMSPTISSEQKNQLKTIKTVTQSIPPSRRGKSLSPKHTKICVACNESIRNSMLKIPYIDQSLTNLSNQRATKIHVDSLSCLENHDFSGTQLSDLTDSTNSFIENLIVAAICLIRNKEWNISLSGLSKLIELCRMIDSDMIYPYMNEVNQRLIQLLKSPRSYVCITACRAASHFFEYIKDTRQPEFDDIVEILLHKTADFSKFIRQDANLALDCMVTHIPTANAIRSLCLKGPKHKNCLVRVATVRLVVCAVVIASPQAILTLNCFESTRRRIFENFLRFVDDKNVDVRKYGIRLYRIMETRKGFKIMLKKYLQNEEYGKLERAMSFLNHRCYSTCE